MGQPGSSCAWRDLGRATRRLPGAGDPRTSGGCRPGACRACHLDRRCAAPCRARRLAGRAGSRHGHLLLDMQDTKAEHPLQPALPASCPKTTGQEITAAASSTPHYADPGPARTLQAPSHPGTCRMCRSGRRPTIRLTEPTSDITEAGGNQEQSPVVLEAFTTARPAEYKSGTAQSGARAARLRARPGVSWLVRSLREAVMSAQPLLGMSAGTRGRPSQPPVPHEDLFHPCGAVPAPSAPDR